MWFDRLVFIVENARVLVLNVLIHPATSFFTSLVLKNVACSSLSQMKIHSIPSLILAPNPKQTPKRKTSIRRLNTTLHPQHYTHLHHHHFSLTLTKKNHH
jgi:hypothetical protein